MSDNAAFPVDGDVWIFDYLNGSQADFQIGSLAQQQTVLVDEVPALSPLMLLALGVLLLLGGALLHARAGS